MSNVTAIPFNVIKNGFNADLPLHFLRLPKSVEMDLLKIIAGLGKDRPVIMCDGLGPLNDNFNVNVVDAESGLLKLTIPGDRFAYEYTYRDFNQSRHVRICSSETDVTTHGICFKARRVPKFRFVRQGFDEHEIDFCNLVLDHDSWLELEGETELAICRNDCFDFL